jgi:hypothetical protein
MTAHRFLDALASRGARATFASLAIAAVAVAGALALIGQMGVSHVARFGHDDAIYLDAGWRVLSGERPHIDFHTPMGLVTPMLMGLAMRASGATAAALGTAVIAFVALTSAWAWAVARGRLSPWLGAVFVLVVASAGVGQYCLSFDWQETSHASLFNRFAYAVLCILLLECLLPLSTGATRAARALGPASSGAAMAILFFLKPSYAVEGAVLVALSGWVVDRGRSRWLAMAAGASLAAAALLLVARTTPGAVLADYATGAAARASGFRSNETTTLFMEMARRDSFSQTPEKLLEIARNDFWTDLAVIGMALLLPAGERRRWSLATAIVLVTAVPVVFTNHQWGEEPSTAALALVLAERALQARGEPPSPPPALALAPPLLLLFVAGQIVFKNFGSVAAAWAFHEKVVPELPAEARFDAPPIHDLVVLRSDGYCRPNQYAQKIDEGLKLLRDNGDDSKKIMVADFSNPFSVALHSPPARGNELWWHLGATFNPTHAPTAEGALGDADVVVIPKCAEETPTRDALLAIYGDYLTAHFDKQAESPLWALYRRKE